MPTRLDLFSHFLQLASDLGLNLPAIKPKTLPRPSMVPFLYSDDEGDESAPQRKDTIHVLSKSTTTNTAPQAKISTDATPAQAQTARHAQPENPASQLREGGQQVMASKPFTDTSLALLPNTPASITPSTPPQNTNSAREPPTPSYTPPSSPAPVAIMTLQQAENTSPPPSPVLSSGPEASVPTRSNSLGSSRPVSTSAARGPASAIAEAKEEEEHKRNVVTLQVAGENPLFVPQDDSSVKPRVSKLVDAAAVKPDAQHTGTNKEFAAVSKPSPTKPRNRKLAPTPVAASSDTRSSTVGRRRSSATSTPSQKRKRGPDADDEYLPDFDDPRTVAYLRRVDTETRDRVTRHIKTSDREFSKVVKKRTRREEEYHDKVDLVETRMDALRDTVLENEKQVEACDMKVRELEEDVEGTNTAMESMEEELDAMRSWVKEVEEKCEKRVAAMEREHRGTKKALADAKEQEKRVADLEKENAAQRTEINEMRKTMEKTLPLMKWFECFPGHGSSV